MRLFVVATSLLTVNTFNDVGGVVWTQRADDTKLWMPPAWKNRLNRTRAQEAAQRAQPPRVPLRARREQAALERGLEVGELLDREGLRRLRHGWCWWWLVVDVAVDGDQR